VTDIRIELEDAETGDEITPDSYTEYEVVRTFIGQGDMPDVFVVTYFVKVHATIKWRHYDVYCEAGEKCAFFDIESEKTVANSGAWWDTVPEVAADKDYNLQVAIQEHLRVCVGPIKVEEVKQS